MDTFSDGPSHQNALDFPLHASSSADMRQQLQNLLDSKEKQLQQAAALGERLLAQRVELEERVRLLQETDADKSDEITTDMRERYRALAEAVRAWDIGNVQLTATFTSSVCILFVHSFFLLVETSAVCFTFLRALSSSSSSSITPTDLVSLTVQDINGSIASQPFEVKEPLRDEPERPKPMPGTSAAQSRRAKNAAHRADDVGARFYPAFVCKHAISDVSWDQSSHSRSVVVF